MKKILLMAIAVVILAAPIFAQGTRTPISIDVVPSTGIVFLDNQRIGPPPIKDWAVLSGPHKITVRINGQVAYSKDVMVNANGGHRFVVTLPAPKKPNR